MVRREIVTLISDLSDVDADETVRFALDGTEYEIDLTTTESTDLRAVLAPYAEAGRRAGGRRRTTSTKTAVASAPSTKRERNAIRAWARANGHDVSDRARIPAAVVAAYHAAQ